MHVMADFTGLTYKEINAIIFLVIQPGLVMFFLTLWLVERRRAIRLKKTLIQTDIHGRDNFK